MTAATFDHLLRYDSKEAALADPAVARYFLDSEPRGDCAFWTSFSSKAGKRQAYDYLWIALPQPSAALRALPNCVLVSDRDAALKGDACIVQSAISPKDFLQLRIEPIIAGSDYPTADHDKTDTRDRLRLKAQT